MAVAASSVLESPATTTQRFCIYRLYQLLKQGGWTVWGSSDATSFSTAGVDHWSTSYASSAANNGAWIALLSPRGDNDRGVALSFALDGKFSLYYTIDGFSATGVDVDTPPTATSVGGYIRNAVDYGMGYSGVTQTVDTLNIVVQDDGSFSFETLNSGALTANIQYSVCYPANPQAPDPNIWYDNLSSGSVLNYFTTGGAFWGIGTANTLVRFVGGIWANVSATYLGNVVTDGWSSSTYINSLIMYQAGAPNSFIGVPAYIKYCGQTNASGQTFGGLLWIKRDHTNSGALVPWDGVTASGTDIAAVPDVTYVDPETAGGGGGTARLPGNGYHRSRRRPRE